MTKYTPEVAVVLHELAATSLKTINLIVANADFCVAENHFILKEVNDLQFLTEELRLNEVTMKISDSEMLNYINDTREDILLALQELGIDIGDSDNTPVTKLGQTTCTTIVPNIDTIVTEVDAEQMGVMSVVLTATAEATTFHQPVELSDTDTDTTLTVEDPIKLEVTRRAALRIGDIMSGNTPVSDVQVSSATAHWFNNGSIIPEVESSESGKHGAKRRQRV